MGRRLLLRSGLLVLAMASAVYALSTSGPSVAPRGGDRSTTVAAQDASSCGDGIIEPGEDCDPELTDTTDSLGCCDASCHFVAAGVPCRPAVDACDVAETCTGASEDCPDDAVAPDGTPCGPGQPPCVADQCSDGECDSNVQPGWCAIDDACVAAGTTSPDGCEICDPSQDDEDWSDNDGLNMDAMRCQLGAILDETDNDCDGVAARRVQRRVARLQLLLGHMESGGNHPRADVRFVRRSEELARVSTRTDCASDETSDLLDQAVALFGLPGGGSR